VALPTRIKFDLLPEHELPRSNTASFSQNWSNDLPDDTFLNEVVSRWRAQTYNPDSSTYLAEEKPVAARLETQPTAPLPISAAPVSVAAALTPVAVPQVTITPVAVPSVTIQPVAQVTAPVPVQPVLQVQPVQIAAPPSNLSQAQVPPPTRPVATDSAQRETIPAASPVAAVRPITPQATFSALRPSLLRKDATPALDTAPSNTQESLANLIKQFRT